MTNWNNISAHGFGASDENWGGNGSASRVDMLDYNLGRLRGSDGKWTLPEVTAAMNAGATQDVRAIDTVPLLRRLLQGSPAPNAAGGEDAVAAGRPGAPTAAAAWIGISTATSTTRERRSWTPPGRGSPTRS